MIAIIAITVISFIIGVLSGAAGVGGLLLLPALNFFLGINAHDAATISIVTYVTISCVLTIVFYKKGYLDFQTLVPFVLGGVFIGLLGSKVKFLLSAPFLTIIVASLILVATYGMIKPIGKGTTDITTKSNTIKRIFLFTLGAFASFMSSMTGIGVNIMSMPTMIFFGFNPLIAIATSHGLSFVSSVSATIGNMLYGEVNWTLGLVISAVQLLGVAVGVRIAFKVDIQTLKKLVATVCFFCALYFLYRGITGFLA